MRIAIVVRRLDVSGGTQKLAIQTARALRARGHEIVFYTFSYAPDTCYPELLSDFKVVEADAAVVTRMRETGAARGLFAFVKNYLNENRAARNLALKIDPATDVLNPHDQLAYRISRYFRKEVKDVRSVAVMNDISTKKTSLMRSQAFNPTLTASLLKKLWYWCVDQFEYRYFVRYQDAVAVLDNRDKKWGEEAFPRVPIHVVRGGLDASEFPYAEHKISKPLNLLMFAVILPHRRFEDGIRALALLRSAGTEATLSIVGGVGDDKYYRTLQELVRELQLEDKVSFKEKVSHETLLGEYRDADIFIFPSHLQSWGLAVFEAMASGLPVVVSETSGASEVLTDGIDSLIVPPYSPEQIAVAVQRLASEPGLHHTLSRAGRRFVEENISWDKYATSMQGLFTEKLRVTEDSSLGTRLGTTCNTSMTRNYVISARTPGTSFTIKSNINPITNKACLSYWIIN